MSPLGRQAGACQKARNLYVLKRGGRREEKEIERVERRARLNSPGCGTACLEPVVEIGPGEEYEVGGHVCDRFERAERSPRHIVRQSIFEMIRMHDRHANPGRGKPTRIRRSQRPRVAAWLGDERKKRAQRSALNDSHGRPEIPMPSGPARGGAKIGNHPPSETAASVSLVRPAGINPHVPSA